MTMWMIRAGLHYEMFDAFEARELVAIRFKVPEDLSRIPCDREVVAFQEAYQRHPHKRRDEMTSRGWQQCVITQGKQLFDFVCKIDRGDLVITFDGRPKRGIYLQGVVRDDGRGDYHYRPDWASTIPLRDYPHIREVTWRGSFKRAPLPPLTKNRLNRRITVFQVNPEDERRILSRGV